MFNQFGDLERCALRAGSVHSADGWDDVLIGHHGSRPAELFLNQPLDGKSIGFEPVYRFVDTIHSRPDRHGCIWGDPNLDGLLDLVCAKGAQQGTAKKWNVVPAITKRCQMK